MKIMKWFILVFCLSFSCLSAFASHGGEDPFPRACVNFSGLWNSDKGDSYGIAQQDCSMIQIHQCAAASHQAVLLTIVPDDVTRNVQGDDWTAQELYRWDQKQYGSSIQTYRTIRYPDRVVTEVVQIEIANANLLLQTTYTKTKFDDGRAPQEQNVQEVFRKASQ